MLTLGLMLSSQEPQEPEKKTKKKEVPAQIVPDTTRVQRDTILVEQRQMTKELKELVEAKKKKEEK
jgi:hypothetical protein